ncbi:secretion protein HlyD [Calothrix parasitica NIES-267]|uniref:Secretion protein HlyD n=1 Tax=Calothrix parasitica NIES-267 TaxID=1973488 RepID=A0A1Z4LI95_9CYAN|nr:secretion protein HlyD [Calothrix parasitica NIES-267]
MKHSDSQTEKVENNPQKAKQTPHLWQRLLLILIPLTLTIGGVAVLYSLLAREKKTPSSTTVQQAPLSVELAQAEPGQIKESSEFIASLQSLRSASIQATTEGKVSQIFVKKGNQVAAQAPLIEIKPELQPTQVSNSNNNRSASLQKIKLQLQNARNTLQELEAQHLSKLQNVRLNQENYEKYSNLAAQGAVSKLTKDEYAQKLQAAKLEFNSLDAKIKTQQATVSNLEKESQQAQLNPVNKLSAPNTPKKNQQYRINAPFKGSVANISVKVGDLVKPSTRVITVNQNQPLEVDIPVPVEHKTQLSKGMLVEIINAKSQNIGTGKVFFISPEVNSNTNTVLVKALFDNPQGKMQAGQFAKARINWNQHSGLLIPTTAVFRIAGEAFVYVAEKLNSTAATSQLVAKQKQVKLGKIIDNKYQVIEGLQPGEKVVVSKLLNIKSGDVLIVQ